MKLPNSWKEVPLKHYIEISEVSFIDMDEIDKAVKILAILSSQSEEDIIELTVDEIARYTKQVSFVFKKYEPKGVPTFIRLKGKRYSLNNDVKSLSGAEYIDFTSLIKDKQDIAKNLPQILAIFLEPINIFGFKKKDCYRKNPEGNYIKKLQVRVDVAKDCLELPSTTAMDLAGFFLKSYESLTKATLNYLKLKQMKTMKILRKEAMALENIGRGS